MQKILLISVILLSIYCISTGQVRTRAQQLITGEDSLQAGNTSAKTVVSGYGSAFYQRDFNDKKASINLERAVLFVGHQFNSKISFFSELEIENAKVSGEGSGGEVAMEQAYLRFNLNSRQYLTAGLFIPRIGLLNENHLPVNFNGVERPIVEQLVIPATWRELGVGFYGRSKRLPLQYSIALVNGLNSSAFEHGSGIRKGRFEGSNATANNPALTGSLQYFYKDFVFQVSGYAGGTNGNNKTANDTLGLNTGFAAQPAYLGEGNVQWSGNRFNAKVLGAYISLPDAGKVNKVYNNNISKSSFGAYCELSYNILGNPSASRKQELFIFGRYEILDLNAEIPSNAIDDGTLKQQHMIVGFSYFPIKNVVIKTDIRFLHTGAENPALIINPGPANYSYRQNNQFLNIGMGYSF